MAAALDERFVVSSQLGSLLARWSRFDLIIRHQLLLLQLSTKGLKV